MKHAGHMMFGNKKITPGGHWMGINRDRMQEDRGPMRLKPHKHTALQHVRCWMRSSAAGMQNMNMNTLGLSH
jgi:hypothetical protein